MSQADIALIVPVLDEARILPVLTGELARWASDADLVVVDGGSRDGTGEALARAGADGAFRVLTAPRGRARQMNAGARATRARILLFLHADTRLPEGALAAVRDAVGAGAIGGCFRLGIASADPRLRLAAGLINLRSSLMPSASGDQAIFVERGAFERAGGFRELALCEDLDLVGRLRRLGRFTLLDAAVETSARRWEARGVTRTILTMWALRLGYHLGVDPATLARLYGREAR